MVKMHAVPLKKQKEKVERVLKRFELRRETKRQEFTIVRFIQVGFSQDPYIELLVLSLKLLFCPLPLAPS